MSTPITAALVKELRDRTGAGMSDCQKALKATDGNVDAAAEKLRIDGMAIGRQAAQFIVDRAEGREVAQRVIDVGFSIVDRDST